MAFAGILTIATESRADSVEFKYFGDTSLDGFNCQNNSRSSFVNRICYNAAESRMLMQLALINYFELRHVVIA